MITFASFHQDVGMGVQLHCKFPQVNCCINLSRRRFSASSRCCHSSGESARATGKAFDVFARGEALASSATK